MTNGAEDTSIWPSAQVLETFGVQAVAPLGGRLNQHWLVSARGVQLVLRRWHTPGADLAHRNQYIPGDDIGYELRLLERVAALGWPVAPAIGEPIAMDGHRWGLFPFLPGDPPSTADPVAEQRARGRLLAEFHADLVRLDTVGQRGDWRRCEEILGDPALDRVLAEHEREQEEVVRLLRWHLDRARKRIAGLRPQDRPGMIIHGDFTPWNLRFRNGRLSGILDFELAHWDHRITDFAMTWRGKHDAIIHGYTELSPLDPEEFELLTPMWWTWLIDGTCRDLAVGIRNHEWSVTHLLRRSPLMGQDAIEYR